MQSTQKNQVYMGGGTWKQLTSEDNCPGPWASTYRLGPLVERPARIASMGATALRRWKLTRLRSVCPEDRAFNGATALRRWKHGREDTDRGILQHPSMGPPPFGDGNRALAVIPLMILSN